MKRRIQVDLVFDQHTNMWLVMVMHFTSKNEFLWQEVMQHCAEAEEAEDAARWIEQHAHEMFAL